MFRNPTPPSGNADEGTVLQVDPIRFLCKVKTSSGQNLDSVGWIQPIGGSSRAGDRVTPTLGDRVKLDYNLGYPLIVGCLPRIQTGDGKFPASIDTGQILIDTGNYSSEGVSAVGDQNKAKDTLVGDRIIGSTGGGMIAILRGGSLLLRSSRLSEIFISKWDDVVRIMSRNFEHFTDVSTDIVKNLRGRVYRYTGYASNFADASKEAYVYHNYYGDTVAAEAIKSNYQTGSAGAANDVIFKEQVTGGSGELMHRTLTLAGNEEVLITAGGTFTRVTSTGAQLTLSFQDQNTITINADEIQAVHQSGATIIMDGSGIRSTFSGGEVNQTPNSVSITAGGHFVTVDGGGVHMG